MTARDLTSTERAVRVLVAQHLPRIDPERATSYADNIHIDTRLHRLGDPWLAKIDDGGRCALYVAIERTFGFVAEDGAWDDCDTVRQLAALVDQHVVGVAA